MVVDKIQRDRLIQQYADGASALAAAWNEAPHEMRAWRPSEVAWSAHEIVVHCADSESYAAIRIRLLAAEPSPLIVGYDQDRWALVFDYHQRSVETALGVVTAVRDLTSSVIRTFSDEQWSAMGTHTDSGRYGAIDWLHTYAVHLHEHAAQIRSNIVAWNERNLI